MQIEYEACFLMVNKDDIREKLKKIGAICIHPERLMRRVNYKTDDILPNSWLRIRDEGDKVTLSLKESHGGTITDQGETCLFIDDFDKALTIFDSLKYKRKSYQETLRETWSFEDVEIVIDTWPGLNPFVEVEGLNENSVRRISERLGFVYSDAFFGPVAGVAYRELGIPEEVLNEKIKEITFANPLREWDEQKKLLGI